MTRQEDRILGGGRHLELRRSATGWEYVSRHSIGGIVAVAAVTDDGRFLLVEQHREAVAAPVIEIPAGLAGDCPAYVGEALEVAARRELLEETGYAGGSWQRLITVAPSAGLCDERATVFLARNVVREGPGGGDASEAITVHAPTLEELDRWLAGRLAEGMLVDPRVFTGIALMRWGDDLRAMVAT